MNSDEKVITKYQQLVVTINFKTWFSTLPLEEFFAGTHQNSKHLSPNTVTHLLIDFNKVKGHFFLYHLI